MGDEPVVVPMKMIHSKIGSHTNMETGIGFQSGMEQMVPDQIADLMVEKWPDQYGHGPKPDAPAAEEKRDAVE